MPWRLFTPNHGPRRVLLLMAVITTAMAAGGTFAGVYAVVRIGGEVDAGKARDDSLADTDRQIRKAFVTIRDSRVASVKLTCQLNKRQNNVLLALIDFSIEQGRRQGRVVPPAVLAKTQALLVPITTRATNRVCRALGRRARAFPPPPAGPKR